MGTDELFFVLPGLPHTLSQDDEYQHTHLPKGTLVIPNILYVGFFLGTGGVFSNAGPQSDAAGRRTLPGR